MRASPSATRCSLSRQVMSPLVRSRHEYAKGGSLMTMSCSAPASTTGNQRVLSLCPAMRRILEPRTSSSRLTVWVKMRCGQCPHIPPRTGSYSRRTASDSACFRHFPVFPMPGIPFESHLGHRKTPSSEGYLLEPVYKCGHETLLCGAGSCLAAGWPVQLWGSGFKVLAERPSACS